MNIFYRIRGRKYYYLMLDMFLVVTSFLTANFIRYYPDFDLTIELVSYKYLIALIISFFVSFYLFQIYRIMWAYSNIKDVYKLMAGNITGFVIFIGYLTISGFVYSRLVVTLAFMFISVSTIIYRIIIRDHFSRQSHLTSAQIARTEPKTPEEQKKIIIIGAGEAGRSILAEYTKLGLDDLIQGFIDDAPHKAGKILNGKYIYGTSYKIHEIIDKFGINEVIIAMPSASSEKINNILHFIKKDNPRIPIRILPPLIELFANKPLTGALREISIFDLIGREEFTIDTDLIRERFSDKCILVTGAGGSIGSEICRQILKYKIRRLIAIGRGEFSIYTLIKSLTEHIEYMEYKPEIIYKIIDVRSSDMLNSAFEKYKPDIVFHAAAHKHVPLMEYNEAEAIINNITGTRNVLEACVKNDVEQFIFISTDKAVRPTNIMGSTKRASELITIYYNRKYKLKTSIVRFGNVIGSRGSVLPLFSEQIEKGGPVTVTDPEIKRFFMSIPEASLLVLNASAYSKGGEIYALDMGKQYKLLDIAERLIELSGKQPGEIQITFTGLRPGEKMYEELFFDHETYAMTANNKIFVMSNTDSGLDEAKIEELIGNQLVNVHNMEPLIIRKMLKNIIPEFEYDESMISDDSCDKFVS
jgi:FlaA1/EpsC-like NDP-sugar epimerase